MTIPSCGTSEGGLDRLTSVEVFVRVADSAGFAAAARLRRMSTTMVSLTEVGRAYYERRRQVLADLDEADRAAGELQAAPRGALRLYVGIHIARFLSPVVTECLARHPQVSLELSIGERMVDLIDGGCDLAIRSTPPPDSSLIVRRLAPWRHVLTGSPAYLEGHETLRRPDDLSRHNCLRYAFYPFGDDWRLVGPDGREVSVRVSGNLVTNSAETLRAMALAGPGIFLAPSSWRERTWRADRSSASCRPTSASS
jgi:DNA-binding transcriptional LysR family regulator